MVIRERYSAHKRESHKWWEGIEEKAWTGDISGNAVGGF
jgi:hypothetical protein